MTSNNSVYEVTPNSFNSSLEVPTSKSYANRALILAAMADYPVEIEGISKSTDVLKMIECLKVVGLDIKHLNSEAVLVKNSFPECESETKFDSIDIYTGDGGTTNRFIAALLARGSKEYNLIPEGHMKNRPMDDLLEIFERLNVTISSDAKDWLRLKGPIVLAENQKLMVRCNHSTQFISAIAMACADKDIDIVPIDMKASSSYYDMTKYLIDILKSKPNLIKIPVDFSSLSYPLALAAVMGEVHIANCLEVDKFQADSVFLKILEVMGVEYNLDRKYGLRLKRANTPKAVVWDCVDCPDLVPSLAFVCSYASGKSILKNLAVLRHKESDRIEEIIKVLNCFEVKHTFQDSTSELIIWGSDKKIEQKESFPPDDHRIVMMNYLFMRKNSGGILHNSHHVAKSFPNFFELMA